MDRSKVIYLIGEDILALCDLPLAQGCDEVSELFLQSVYLLFQSMAVGGVVSISLPFPLPLPVPFPLLMDPSVEGLQFLLHLGESILDLWSKERLDQREAGAKLCSEIVKRLSTGSH